MRSILTRQFLFAFLVSTIFMVAGCSKGNSQTGDKQTNQEQSNQGQTKQDHSSQAHSAKADKSKKTHQHDKKYTNELVNETSPYLLMHAHNPVNWHGWNEATLAKAKKEDKAIFLSIGYSSCHWCHVMENESFVDEEIAKFLNENFICIKVDREERPDVDEIYMHALSEIKPGGGGWPLSMFMTPDTKPFFGGTYWPARDGDRGARMGFLSIVKRVDEHYRNNRAAINKDAEVVTKRTVAALGARGATNLPLQKSWNNETIDHMRANFDAAYGGFGFSAINPNRPKFPEPSNLFFFIDQIKNNPDETKQALAKNMLVKTCEGMMMGGIYDHLGGGFHRYSVDRFWHIPHFEKMLYDNGQLATVYAEAYALTGREEFKNVVEGILSFVDRELVADSGGIYSALDADSEGEEGKFYRWELKEIKEALTAEEYKLFASIYGLNEEPNFEDEYYAPQLNRLMSSHAKEKSLSLAELEGKLQVIRTKLFDVRSKRVRPLLDSKILTAWNGLMIRGYADAGRILKNEDYVKTAAKAAEFALQELVNEKGHLYRTHTQGKARLNAYVIDYACLIDSLIALHRATGESMWLKEADALQAIQDDLFWDEEGGGYFYTSKDHEVLLARSKRTVDGAIPSGNSLSAANLIYLSRELVAGRTDADEALRNKAAAYREKSNRTLKASAAILMRAPHAAPRMLISTSEFLRK